MTPTTRFITKPGCRCVCMHCGSALDLTCPKGHPAEYVIGEETAPHPGNLLQNGPAPDAEPKKSKKPKWDDRPSTGTCITCTADFTHEKRKGRRSVECPECRAQKVAA